MRDSTPVSLLSSLISLCTKLLRMINKHSHGNWTNSSVVHILNWNVLRGGALHMHYWKTLEFFGEGRRQKSRETCIFHFLKYKVQRNKDSLLCNVRWIITNSLEGSRYSVLISLQNHDIVKFALNVKRQR